MFKMKVHSQIFVAALALLVSSAHAKDPYYAPYTPVGCWRHKSTDGKLALNGSQSYAKDYVTVEECVKQCAEGGFYYAGIRAGVECSCGDAHAEYGESEAEDCSVQCPVARPSEVTLTGKNEKRTLQETETVSCGGPESNSVFVVGESIAQFNDKMETPDAIHFPGPGCVDYDFTEGGWVDLPFVDDINVPVAMGIDFDFNDATYNDVTINSNGHLHFGNGGDAGWQPPPDMKNHDSNAIAPFWADINIARAGHIRYKSFPNEKFVVVWQEVAAYGKDPITPNTFQVVLSDNGLDDKSICFCYCQMTWATCCSSECGKTGLSTEDPGEGFLLAQWDYTNNNWNGFETDQNGVGHLQGRSYCFNSNMVEAAIPKNKITETHNPGGCAQGDPHFKTWQNEHYEYHGQCDLVLAKDPEFADGLGLDVHIRTKLVRHWSFIKAAVIRIGNDILEVEGASANLDGKVHYWYNYEYQGELTEFAGFPVTIRTDGTKKVEKTYIEIDMSSKYPGEKIELSTFKEFVKVNFSNPTAKAFGKTVGMLGDFNTGKTMARDGATVLHDFTDLGREWQVLPSDGNLFHEKSFPQFPELCIEPEDPRGDRQRRLAESNITMEQAEAACASIKDVLDRKDCVYDILATQDMDMVGAF